MSEELAKYYAKEGIKIEYLHSEIDAIERNHLIRNLRLGVFDVLVGINLLREGLDLPEVSLVAIMDADKEGFLRSETSLIQTMGRAARNVNGKVILYAEKITNSMRKAMDTTTYRRKKQEEFNKKHGEELRLEDSTKVYDKMSKKNKIPAKEKENLIKDLKIKMLEASKRLDFEAAIQLRDEIARLRSL